MKFLASFLEKNKARLLIRDQPEHNNGVESALDSIQPLFTEAVESLESIASLHWDLESLKTMTVEQLREVIETDTRIARSFLKNLKETK